MIRRLLPAWGNSPPRAFQYFQRHQLVAQCVTRPGTRLAIEEGIIFQRIRRLRIRPVNLAGLRAPRERSHTGIGFGHRFGLKNALAQQVVRTVQRRVPTMPVTKTANRRGCIADIRRVRCLALQFELFPRTHNIEYFPLLARIGRIDFAHKILFFECKPRMRPALFGEFDYVNHRSLLSAPEYSNMLEINSANTIPHYSSRSAMCLLVACSLATVERNAGGAIILAVAFATKYTAGMRKL